MAAWISPRRRSILLPHAGDLARTRRRGDPRPDAPGTQQVLRRSLVVSQRLGQVGHRETALQDRLQVRAQLAELDSLAQAYAGTLQVIALILDPALHDPGKCRAGNRAAAAVFGALRDCLRADLRRAVQPGKLHFHLGAACLGRQGGIGKAARATGRGQILQEGQRLFNLAGFLVAGGEVQGIDGVGDTVTRLVAGKLPGVPPGKDPWRDGCPRALAQ